MIRPPRYAAIGPAPSRNPVAIQSDGKTSNFCRLICNPSVIKSVGIVAPASRCSPSANPTGSVTSKTRKSIPSSRAHIIGRRTVIRNPCLNPCPLTNAGPSPNTNSAPAANVTKPRSSASLPNAKIVSDKPILPTFGKIVVATRLFVDSDDWLLSWQITRTST